MNAQIELSRSLLECTVIIDSCETTYSAYASKMMVIFLDNTIQVPVWTGEARDRALSDCLEIIEQLSLFKLLDVSKDL